MEYILIGTIIGGIIWGIVVNKVIENKGYEENWFWWGFFFGIFALIIALTKQSVNTTKVVIESSAPVKENMELLSSCILNNQVNISSPVHIASWEIKKDTEKLVLFVDFINVSHKAISAVMFSATGYNSFGDIVRVNNEDFFDVIGQDLSIKPNGCGKVYTTLQDNAIRKVEIKIKKICFADGTIVDDIQDKWVNTNQFELNSIHIDCARRENAQSKYYAIINEHYWQCVCGFVNIQNICAICGMQKNSALKYTEENFDSTYSEYLKQLEAERVAEEKRKLEEEQLKAEQQTRAKKNKKIMICSTCVIAFCLVFATILNIIVIPNYKYNKAIELAKTMNYDEACKLFSELDDYKDSKEQLNIIKPKASYGVSLKYAEVNDVVILGEYEQDDDFQNGKEEIEWIVIDKQDDKILVISKYVLDSQPYNMSNQNTTWSSCTLRKWLNNDFLHSTFTEEQKEKIISTSLSNPDNPEFGTKGGDYTTDKVFLLSIEEANKYFLSDGDRVCKQTPYADNRSAFPSRNGTWWWLRSPGTNSNHAASVHPGGKPSNYGFFVNDAGNTTYLSNSGVRPAMWLSIN